LKKQGVKPPFLVQSWCKQERFNGIYGYNGHFIPYIWE
jgi:hypothetical protein